MGKELGWSKRAARSGPYSSLGNTFNKFRLYTCKHPFFTVFGGHWDRKGNVEEMVNIINHNSAEMQTKSVHVQLYIFKIKISLSIRTKIHLDLLKLLYA